MKNTVVFKKIQKPLVLLVFILLLSLLAPTAFPTANNISNVLWSISTIGIMTCGSIFVILLGGIDLSLGSVMAVSGAVTVKIIMAGGHTTASAILGISVAMLLGVAIGAAHGLIITQFRVPAFLVTFASQIILSGAAQLLLDNRIISCLEPGFFTAIGMKKILGFPLPIYFMGIAMLISYYALTKTDYGRRIYAVGGNAVAAELSGINSRKTTISAYMLSGLTAAISGVVLSSMTQQAMASAGSGYETEVITAIVVGGTSLIGGEGTIPGALFGVILIGLLNNAMNLLTLPATVHPLVKGIVIVCAVAADTLGKDKDRSWLSGLLAKRMEKKK